MSELTEEEAQQIMRDYAQGQANAHTFLQKVVQTKDTTRVGNLKEEELGLPKIPLRTYKELALFCDSVIDKPEWSDYLTSIAEIQTSTSLSKDAILLKLNVTSKKELADVTPKAKVKNSGWFKSRNNQDVNQFNPQM